MFQQSGLQAGPTTGNVDVNPATLIPDNGLTVAQIPQLQASLSQKHPLLGPGDLPQDRVANLSSDLAAKADATSTISALAGKAAISDLSAKADLAAMKTVFDAEKNSPY